MVEFYIGTAHVDMSRSQITTDFGTFSLEPKVMQVLLMLAKNQGEVVTHDTILRAVWPNTVTSANAIQRCIGQLRKVLNDTAQSQLIIATHPKIGYSLIPTVKWRCPDEKESEEYGALSISNQRPVWVNNRLPSMGGVLFLTIAVLIALFMPTSTELTIKSLTPLTATDHIEQKPSFSPNGQYIVFQRFIENCKNQLWGKELSTNVEYLLTKEVGNYGVPRWSPNGERIVFTSAIQCNPAPDNTKVTKALPKQKNEYQECSEIRGISFNLAKSSPQPSTLYHRCDLNTHSQPVWLTAETIAFITKQPQATSITHLNIRTNDTRQLHRVDNKTISALDYSSDQNKLAWVEYKQYLPLELGIYDSNTQSINKVTLDEYESLSYIYHMRWLFNSPLLLVSKNNHLFTIALSGKISSHLQPAADKILYPALNPIKKQLVASMGNFDRDIGQTKWHTRPTQSLNAKTIFARSNVDEFKAKKQPNGALVAFISSRSGNEQVWLYDTSQKKVIQLSHFTHAINLTNILWNANGSALFILAHKRLYLLNLDGKLTTVHTPLPLVDIYQDRGHNQLLVKQLEDKTPTLVQLNLDNQQIHPVYSADADKALFTQNGELFIIENQTIYNVINAKRYEITPLNEIEASGLFTYQGQLYITTSTNDLWLYHPRLEQLTHLANLDSKIDNISDINVPDKTVYFSRFVNIKKELMLLDLE
ncbi:hypothetical protein JF50_09990 [Pseudoalteromonas luteoviolacea]|uniref:OmpR/PhoB-type domain-containing protein n=1 Tax=Pseudoalteromonas luteoviolacea TaxID=43657 RepID=A0A0C1MKE1_9GAMM|nr:winged helix-turn-helix domain-containing protein [Pseudoalteromonas luteoviolacea]KID57514.1 hypothetical protein JF50_09990 [Pseudoalteromonas luteoviolacea]